MADSSDEGQRNTIECAAERRRRDVLKETPSKRPACHPERKLRRRRQQVLDDLEDAAAQMSLWAGATEEQRQAKRQEFLEDRAALTQSIAKAIRAGFADQPIVKEWLSQERLFGNREALRRFKDLRLEKGVRRPISKTDFWIVFHAASLIDQAQLEGERLPKTKLQAELRKILDGGPHEAWFDLAPEDIGGLRKTLMASRQAFHQRLTKLHAWLP